MNLSRMIMLPALSLCLHTVMAQTKTADPASAAKTASKRETPPKAEIPSKEEMASKDEMAIRNILTGQADAWNKGSIDEFMKGYWKNDSLLFVSQSGLSYGYTRALSNYKKNYSDRSKMGMLFFTLVKLARLSHEYYFVTGKWLIKRSGGDIGGYYTLLFRKIGGTWVIVTDHTS